MKLFYKKNLEQNPAELPVVSPKSRPFMLWVSAIALVLSMAWAIIPLSTIFFNALADNDRLASMLNFFGVVILLYVVVGSVVCVVMAIGLLRKTEWAWVGALLSVHGIFAPPLAVLFILYVLTLTIPSTHQIEMKYLMSDYLLRIIAPYGLTYLFLLLCLTRASVKKALAVNE